MSKKIFNPTDWQLTESTKQPKIIQTAKSIPIEDAGQADIDLITQRIETASIDIAPSYSDWRDLGFALADALGESGRNYYHRLSRFYPSYSQDETDKQYSACLASHGHGVTIKTFYHLAKSSGVDVSVKNQVNQKNHTNRSSDNISSIPQSGDLENMGKLDFSPMGESEGATLPAFPKEIFESLPGLLHAITSNADSPEDADLLLLGSLTVSVHVCQMCMGYMDSMKFFLTYFFLLQQRLRPGKEDFPFAVVW